MTRLFVTLPVAMLVLISQTNSTGNGAQNSVTFSTFCGAAELPVIYSKDKTLVFRIGDPVEYDYKGKKTVFTIANIDYNGTYKGMKAYGYYEEDIDLNKIDLVNGYAYHHYPADVVNGSGDKFKEGDRVEVICRYDDLSDYKWIEAIVVSVDGDNYYVYRPGSTRDGQTEFFWQYISDVRAVGSGKTTATAPKYGNDNTKPGVDDYLRQIKNGCPFNDWHFIWFYRHEYNPVEGFDEPNAFIPGEFKKMLDEYDCKYGVRKNLPDIGISGADLALRYDVQWEFLQKRKEYITAGLQRMSQGSFNSFLLEVKNAKYQKELAKVKGMDGLKALIREQNDKYEKAAALMGVTLEYPWDQLDKAYQEGLKKFMDEIVVPYAGLKYDGTLYQAKDAKAEAVAIKFIEQYYPGTKILAAGASADFYINKNDIGIPTNRAKGVVVLHQDPAYRTCILTYCFYQEDYAGGGTYNTGHINGQLTGNQYLKTCK